MRLRTTILVAIAGALFGVATGCGAEPADKEAGLLVYDVGTQNGTASAGLFVVDDQGRRRRRLTSEPPPTSVTYAKWSPMGRTILLTAELSFAEEFWTIEADGTGLHRIGKGSGAIWSPDGSEIAIGKGDDVISIVDTDGSPLRTIRLGLEKGLFADVVGAWSPDGTLLAIDVLNESTEGLIYVVATDAKSHAKPLGKREEGVSEEGPVWSPDGKSIAFIRVYGDAGDGDEVWVMQRDGTGRRRVATGAQDVKWSADGKSLLFSASYPLAPGLYRVPVDVGDPVRVADKFGETEDFREPGGKRVLRFDHGRLVVSRLDGSGKKILTDPRAESGPVWSPDGARIAFVRGREYDRNDGVYVVGADGKGERRVAMDGWPEWLRDGRLLISRSKGFAVADVDPDKIAMPVDGGSAVVSPDGGSIAFLRERAVHSGYGSPEEDLLVVQSTLFVQRSDGSGVRALAKTSGTEAEPLVFDVPVWAPDGGSILIEEHDPMAGGRARIRQIPVHGGSERTVAGDELSNLEYLAIAPDGKRIAFATNEGIDVVELDGNERKTVAGRDRVGVSGLKWSPDGEKLAYVGWHPELEDVYELFVVDADGSNGRLVSKPGDAVGAFDWAP